MALEHIHLRALRELPKGKLLCLGYPDALVTADALHKEFHLTELKLAESPNAAYAKHWHGWDHPIVDTDWLLRTLGFEPTYVDIKQHRGPELVVDLNLPVDATWWEKFDVVADLGTAEHCFNLGRVFGNIRTMLKPDGFVLHANPLSMPNHGFVSISPGLYHDWYRTVHHHYAYWGEKDNRQLASLRQ